MDKHHARCATGGRSTATAGPTRTTRSSRAEGASADDPHADHQRQGRLPHRRRGRRRARSTARRSPPSSRPARFCSRCGVRRRDGRSTPPASTSIPGGIDVHTHMELPFGGTFASDTFETGTRGRGVGRHHHDRRLRRAAHRRERAGRPRRLARARPTGNCAIDYGFHQIIGGVDDESLKAMTLPRRARGHHQLQAVHGLPGRASTATTARSCGRCRPPRDCGAMIMMHAENGIAIDVLVAQALARGETDPQLPRAAPGPSELEAEATHRAIVLAKVAGNVPLYIVHMSAGEALERGRGRPRTPGRNVFAETCPQYLYLTLEEHARRTRASRARSGSARRRCARKRRAPPGRACGRACA